MSKNYTNRSNSLNSPQKTVISKNKIGGQTFGISEVRTVTAPGITRIDRTHSLEGHLNGSTTTTSYQTVHEEIFRANRKQIDKNIDQAMTDVAKYEEQQTKIEEAEQTERNAKDKLDKAKTEETQAKQEVDAANFEKDNAQTNLQNLMSENPNPEPGSEADRNIKAAQARVNDANQKANEAKAKEETARNKTKEAQAKQDDASKKVQDLKKNAKKQPQFTKQDVETAKSQIRNASSTKGGAIISQRRTTTATANNKPDASNLIDLRNLSNGNNFRNIGNAGGVVKGITLSPSRSFFLNDYRFAETLTLNDDILSNPKAQPLILNEFQPYEMISPADVLNGVGEIITKAINWTTGALAAPIVKGGSKVLINKMIDSYAKDSKQIYGEGGTRQAKYFTSDPVQVVQNMFMGGRWLNTYELPYFGGQYLKAAYSNNWTIGDSSGFLGAGLTGNDSSIGTKMMGIDFPSNPKFKVQMNQGRDPISLEFYLINSDNDWLKRNFQFLNALYAGSNWLHLKYCFIRPPNVYHVVCPGRFQIYWAAIDVTVTFEGKLRKNTTVSQELRSYSKAITDDMLWPDAWKININIKDLTPNNFNLYAEYYLNGLNTNELAEMEGDQVDRISGAVAEVVNYFDAMKKDKAVADALKSAKNLANNALEKGKELGEELLNKIPKEVKDSFTPKKDRRRR